MYIKVNAVHLFAITFIKILNLHNIVSHILMVTFQQHFGRQWKTLMLVFGSSFTDRKSFGDKAIVGYPKANRGWPPFTTSRIWVGCLENLPTSTPQHIDLKLDHIGTFNTMYRQFDRVATNVKHHWKLYHVGANIVLKVMTKTSHYQQFEDLCNI